jgi:indolepyruvate ferredoxin oxidoreductase
MAWHVALEEPSMSARLLDVSLDDKYRLESGRIYVNGTQALARLPFIQRRRDARAGLHTAGFISGYRGSPLGSFDQALWQAQRIVADNAIHFRPGINEDLAATAVWGTQQVNAFGDAKYDGVFALWYGKGPGVDRCGDVFKHGNAAGSSPHGGVLLVAGDDHAAKSSTLPHQSDYAFMDAGIPFLAPAGIQEVAEFGVLGWAMSRYSGCWVGFKALTSAIDSSSSIDAAAGHALDIRLPTDFVPPPDGVHLRLTDDWWQPEARAPASRSKAPLRLRTTPHGREVAHLGNVGLQVWRATKHFADGLGISRYPRWVGKRIDLVLKTTGDVLAAWSWFCLPQSCQVTSLSSSRYL